MRPRKTHLRRANFCSFCLNTLRVILTDDLCVRRTWKIKPEKELEQDFSIFFGSMTVSSLGLRTAYMYNTAERLGQWHGLRLSAASKTFAWVLFSTKKRVQHLAFWLFWFCVCGHWLLSPSPHGHLASARSGWLAKYGTHYTCTRAIDIGNCSCSALHRSTIKLDEKEVFLEVEDTLGHLRL